MEEYLKTTSFEKILLVLIKKECNLAAFGKHANTSNMGPGGLDLCFFSKDIWLDETSKGG